MILLSNIDFTLPLADPVLKFLLILLIILAAPLLLNKLRVPHLLGLIIAGAIIGPNGFNLVLRDSSIILSGTAGLLYIMFLAGLEIDMGDFKKNSGKSLVFGMYTFLIPMILGTIVGLWVLDFSMETSVLLASMFASHTLIAYPIISKLGISKNNAVSITVGGTMITDTLALLVLTIIVGMATGNADNAFWIRLGVSIVIFALIVLLVFPFIGRWFFKRVHDNISQYIFVLSMVFFGAFLAQLAGMEAIIGSFLAADEPCRVCRERDLYPLLPAECGDADRLPGFLYQLRNDQGRYGYDHRGYGGKIRGSLADTKDLPAVGRPAECYFRTEQRPGGSYTGSRHGRV